MRRTIDAKTLKDWLHDAGEIALFDVREHGQYGESHLFYAAPLPYSRLELDIARLVPRRLTRTVLCDDGALGVAQRAAARLEAMGYSHIHVLENGTRGWAAAGYGLFAGVNVPSKTFGEMAEHHYKTPRVKPRELAGMIERGENVVVIDGRPLGEYRKMNIPGSLCCPNGELAYRIGEMVPDPQTRIVVNCAGRTRSIIGAQTLINLGIPNPVYALENGTQGWCLEDLELEHGSARGYPEVPAGKDLAAMREHARALASAHGVGYAGAAEVNLWLADASRTTYLFDVRTAEEFEAGSVLGAVHAPGGQLLQATDHWIAVRNARIVLVDDDGLRAPVTASWLRQMGHQAWVLNGGLAARIHGAPLPTEPLPPLEAASVGQLAAWLAGGGATVVDLRPSMSYRKGHVPRSLWSIRPRLGELKSRLRGRVVLVADEAGVAQLAARDLAKAGVTNIGLLVGGFAAWQEARRPVDASPGVPADEDCIDFLFFVHDRHDGNKDAARRYLAWETGLLAQLDARERSTFRFDARGAAG